MADRERPTLHVEFFTRPLENVKQSKIAGRPIFDDREMVRLRFPGDRNRTFEAFATERTVREPGTNNWLSFIDRFPEHYAAFKKGMQYIGEGTPIAELPFLTEAKRAELRAVNIHTAEALAQLDGTPLKQLGMGGRELKNQAQAWIDKASGSADMTRMAAENAGLREQMEALQKQMAELAAGRPLSPTPTQASRFAHWSPEEIKSWINEQTGQRPKGNPSHATLIQMADDLAAQQKAAEPAATEAA